MSARSFKDSIWRDHNGPVWSSIGLIAQLCGDIARSTPPPPPARKPHDG